MEPLIDRHIQVFRRNLDHWAESGDFFDLKRLISFYVLDVLGELAFSRSFNSQVEQNVDKLPPINDHVYLSCMLGQLPELLPYLKKIAEHSPIPWFQRLFAARKRLVDLTADCVRTRLSTTDHDRKDLLTCLINAVDPETGARLTELDINTEAFAMMYVTLSFCPLFHFCSCDLQLTHTQSCWIPHHFWHPYTILFTCASTSGYSQKDRGGAR